MLTMITQELIKQYYRLILHETAQKYAIAKIEGNEVKYPHQVIYKQSLGKEETEYKYLTHEQLTASIEGKLSLGVMLIQDKTGLTKSGCIDLDSPRDFKTLNEGLALAKKLREIALKSNLRAYVEFSGNRGYHLWIFANKPVTGELMQNCLNQIALNANFEAKEIFPNKYPQESKVIKLPFTTHLKSSLRSGFLPFNFDVNNPQIELSSQVEIMANFAQNDVSDILECANSLNNQNSVNGKEVYQGKGINSDNRYSPKSNNSNTANSQNKPVNQDEIISKLTSFRDRNPSCINFLLNNGAPLEIEYNQANLTLVRYCLTRGFSLEDSLPMAELMAKNTSENHSTGKDYRGKIENFKSVFQSASRNSDDYLFNCSYVLSGYKRGNKGKLSDRGCIGSKCSLFKTQDKSGINQNVSDINHNNYPQNSYNQDYQSKSDNYQNISDTVKYYPLPSLIFEAMVNLTNEDKEICKSNLLLTIEPKLILDNQVSNQGSESEKLIESEVLSYLIHKPDIITDYLELFPQGFITTTDKGLSEYIDYLLTLEIPSEDTIEAHIDLIREKGIKEIASNNYSRYIQQLKEADYFTKDSTINNKSNLISEPLQAIDILTKTIDDTESLLKQSLSDKNLLPVSAKANQWLESMFDEDIISIPTFSQDLNYLLNGGLARGKLYVLGAPPANGKSTISAQIGDLASSKGFKIGYASYEMSAEQLFSTGLSRLGKINSSLIEGKKYFKDEKLFDKILATFTKYLEKIAPNLHIIEADDLYTPSRLLAIIKKLNLDLLIVDYLQLMSSGDPKLDNAYQETLRVSKIATELKRIARKSNIPIIAISDINKNAYSMAIKGGDLDMSALRDSFKIAHSADVIMLLMSQDVPIAIKNDEGKKAEQMVTQLYLLAEKFREKSINLAQKIEMLAHEYRLEKETADTYSRLIIAKNRTGKCGEVLFRYSKALHYFDAMDYHTDSVNINEDF